MALVLPSRVVVCSKNQVKVAAVREAFSRALPHLKLEVTGVSSSSGVADQPWGDAETLTGALNRVASMGREHSGDLIVAIEGGVGPGFTLTHPLTAASNRAGGAGGVENAPPNPGSLAASRGTGGAGGAPADGPAADHLGACTVPPPGAGSATPSTGSSSGPGGLECFAWAVVRAPSGALSQARSASFALPPRVAELVHQGLELGAADDAVFSRVNSGQGSGTIGRLTLVGGQPLISRAGYYTHAVLMALVPLMNGELYPGFELPGGTGGS